MAKNLPDIIYEDDDLIAINKPSGLLTIADRDLNLSLKELLQRRYGNIYTIHRIDKDTSGIVLFARNPDAHRYYSRLFENREIEKYYVAIVVGCPASFAGELKGAIMEHPTNKGKMVIHRKGKEAHTSYEILDGHRSYSMLRFHLHTGRTHQIRVHASDAGFPIACDPLYGNGNPVILSSIKRNFKHSKTEDEERPILDRLALHAYQLSFTNRLGKKIFLEAPVPKSFLALMKQIRKWEL